MSGDSAGGNLVASMQIYMLQNNLLEFMADHLLFVYAILFNRFLCSNTRIVLHCIFFVIPRSYAVFMVSCTAMTPSRILSLFDPMLPYETVRMCLAAYLGAKEHESDTNPLISPIVASDEILSKFPPTTLVAAQVLLARFLVNFMLLISFNSAFVSAGPSTRRFHANGAAAARARSASEQYPLGESPTRRSRALLTL
jgi:hypothetical protein